MSKPHFAKSRWTPDVELIDIGGGWGIAVGTLETGDIRIAKGKIKPNGTDGDESNCPVSQIQRLNIKPHKPDQWDKIKAAVDERLENAILAA